MIPWKLPITALLIFSASFLGGCAHTEPAPEPIVRTVEVEVPVDDPACARALMERLGQIPAYPDSETALREVANIFEGVQLLKAGRELRTERERELVAGIEACAR